MTIAIIFHHGEFRMCGQLDPRCIQMVRSVPSKHPNFNCFFFRSAPFACRQLLSLHAETCKTIMLLVLFRWCTPFFRRPHQKFNCESIICKNLISTTTLNVSWPCRHACLTARSSSKSHLLFFFSLELPSELALAPYSYFIPY